MDPLRALVERLETDDPATARHGRSVAEWADRIAARLHFADDDRFFIARSAMLHDVGKLYVPQDLLSAPRRLSVSETDRVRMHVIEGERVLALHPELFRYRDAVRWHHERIDGNGYPDGLKGERIPIVTRIVAVADAYDAMTSARPYQLPLTPHAALLELERNRGTQFDPEIVDAMIACVCEAIWPVAV